MVGGNRNYEVDIETGLEDVTVRITLPAEDAGLIGVITAGLHFDLVAFVSIPREPV
jgi:hypothetical protein